MYGRIAEFIKGLYRKDPVPLHEPLLNGKERDYVLDCIDSTFVSSVGEYVSLFEDKVAAYVGVDYAVATVNGTSALHLALVLAGVDRQTEVITQPLTFVATCNAIRYCGAIPLFIDVDEDTFGMSAEALSRFLETNASLKDGVCINRRTGRPIKACVPMHTFGHPCRIDKIASICREYSITLIEDAAEALGTRYRGRHVGTFGDMGVFSFNGNKIITTGGGGMVVTDDPLVANRARHLATTAKVAHPYEYIHDEVGYNYRMPNINAAIGCAQMERIDEFVSKKRRLAAIYNEFFDEEGLHFVTEPKDATSNYWLNGVVFDSPEQRDEFIEYMLNSGIMVRPVWRLMTNLSIYSHYQSENIDRALYFEQRVVNIPSSANYREEV